jgi:hypothetical protein
VTFSVGALLMDADAPAGALVFGRSPQVTFKQPSRPVRTQIFSRGGGAAP